MNERSDEKECKESEVEILKEWKGLRKVVIGLTIIGCYFLTTFLSSWMAPVVNLKDLKVVEGELVTIVPNEFRRLPSITLKVNGSFYLTAKTYIEGLEPLLGKKIKVWTQEDCRLVKYICTPYVKQMEYEGQLLLKYDMQEWMSSRKDAIWFAIGFPLFFFILAIVGAVEGIKRRNKKLNALIDIKRGV